MKRITAMQIQSAHVKILLLLLICFSVIPGKGQIAGNGRLNSTIEAMNSLRKRFPIEKLYVDFDNEYYFTGDTIRFKAYLLNADFLTLSDHSGLLYAELDDKNNKAIKRVMLPVASGLSWGGIPLEEKNFPDGNYTLRVYTNWMRNFGDDYIFKKSFYIASASAGQWLVTADGVRQKDQFNIHLRFIGLKKQPISNRPIQLQVTDGKKSLYTGNIVTSANGELSLKVSLPDKIGPQHIIITATGTNSGKTGSQLTIPLSVAGDVPHLKFMPEGETFIAGINTLIGFKASGEDGKGQQVSGYIYDDKRQKVARINTVHNGIGSFKFTPKAGETYTAEATLKDGTINYYVLPKVAISGTSLKIEQLPGDSLCVKLRVSNDLLNNGKEYYLMAAARGIICYAAAVHFKDTLQAMTIPYSLFPSGITRFTLLNADHVPLNDRMVFIDHRDNLDIHIQTDRAVYGVRDSIALKLRVTDKSGDAVRGSFSVAVTDDGQVLKTSMENNILYSMLLTSDLKENVEEPGYYFANGTGDRVAALDNLLLTESWLGYDWKDVFGPDKIPSFTAEREFTVSGKVTNLFNKPVPQTQVVLLSKKPLLLKDTLTDENGRFAFKGLFPVDTALFLVQAKNRHGKRNNISISLDDFKSPVFTGIADAQLPWYINTDSTLLTHVAARNSKMSLLDTAHLLAEVTITGKKIVRGSKNLNGPGEADQILDEADVNSAGKTTLRMLLEQKIKGFAEGQFKYPADHQGVRYPGDPVYRISYKINEKEIRFVFDGIDVDAFYYPPDVAGDITPVPNNKREYINSLSDDRKKYLDTYLDFYTTEDIKGIEVMANARYNSNYVNKFLSAAELMATGVSPNEKYAYLEITTRSGSGPFLKNVPGTVLYKPLAFSLPKPFYSPRYGVKNIALLPGTDLRSVLYWDPALITDGWGKSVCSFFSADKPGSYTITIEGTDINGDIGYKQQQIKIIPK